MGYRECPDDRKQLPGLVGAVQDKAMHGRKAV